MGAQKSYLENIQTRQATVEDELQRISNTSPPSSEARRSGWRAFWSRRWGGRRARPAVQVRVTGFWRWKNVVVPPNAYAVHTRRGSETPLHLALGTSFRFNPVTDSYLVVPAAMQTVIFAAPCISREKQGVRVHGSVQWVIEDFEAAYRRLDFSDAVEPMWVVNAQLREQAESIVKDTVATMSLERVLGDRQPMIKELTNRLRVLVEGQGPHRGLGLRVVTAQIKETVVSSEALWADLQRPFRAERAKDARLAELEHEAVVRAREAEARRSVESLRVDTDHSIAQHTAQADAAAFDAEQAESVRRARVRTETTSASVDLERQQAAKRAELETQRIELEGQAAALRFEAENRRARVQLETDVARREVENDLSDERLREWLIASLPELVERVPRPGDPPANDSGGAERPAELLMALLRLVDDLRRSRNTESSDEQRSDRRFA